MISELGEACMNFVYNRILRLNNTACLKSMWLWLLIYTVIDVVISNY